MTDSINATSCSYQESTKDDVEMARSEESDSPSTTSSISSTENKKGIRRINTLLTLNASSDDSSESGYSQGSKNEKSQKRQFGYCLVVGILLILAAIVGVTIGVVSREGRPSNISAILNEDEANEFNDTATEFNDTESPSHSSSPSTEPSIFPSEEPSVFPSAGPSSIPSGEPSSVPTVVPTMAPTVTHSSVPSSIPTTSPTSVPTISPSSSPSVEASTSPTSAPTMSPSSSPSVEASISPTRAPTISPSSSPSVQTLSPTPFPTHRFNNADSSKTNSDKTVGVFYYPWYGNSDFHGRRYLRNDISPKQLPAIGEYDQRDTAVFSKHLEMTRQANINLWVTSWWGPTSTTNRNLLTLLDNKDLPGTKIALFYETVNRMPNADTRNVYNDVSYAARTFFGNPNYFRINGCPAFYIYLARNIDDKGKLVEAANIMRQAAKDNGHCIYLVGDVAHGTPKGAGYRPFEVLDAITEYDVFGSMDRPRYAGQSGVDKFRDKQAAWRKNAMDNGCAFMPTVTPGYNEKGVRDRSNPMSRKLTAGSGFGSLFQALLANAVQLTDPSTGDIIMVNSWNEWHEDTQIEPVGGSGRTASPNSKTTGLEYEAYGNRYLNILAAATNRK